MIGVDLVHIEEFKKQLDLGGKAFIDRAFHPSEVRDGTVEHLAGLWAAKEAITKAAGLKPGQWLDITISYQDSGRPIVRLADHSVEVSIAHHGDYAVAMAQEGAHE